MIKSKREKIQRSCLIKELNPDGQISSIGLQSNIFLPPTIMAAKEDTQKWIMEKYYGIKPVQMSSHTPKTKIFLCQHSDFPITSFKQNPDDPTPENQEEKKNRTT